MKIFKSDKISLFRLGHHEPQRQRIQKKGQPRLAGLPF